MSGITLAEKNAIFIGLCLEGFFYGLYSAIFVMYLQYEAPKNGSQKRRVLFYALCTLYVLSVVTIVLQVDTSIYLFIPETSRLGLDLDFIQGAVSGCCDFISQSILIYRCWVVWGCNTRVVILPSILAFTSLATWQAADSSLLYNPKGELEVTYWGYILSLTSLAISLTVNALVTGLIVLRIFKVYQEVKPTLDDQCSDFTSRSKTRSVIFVLIESGMALFAVQVVRFVISIFRSQLAFEAFNIVFGIHEMLNGITPTSILVRVAMGLSFHDEQSMIETTGNLHWAPYNPNLPHPETGRISIEHYESLESLRARPGDIDDQLSNNSDIQIVER